MSVTAALYKHEVARRACLCQCSCPWLTQCRTEACTGKGQTPPSQDLACMATALTLHWSRDVHDRACGGTLKGVRPPKCEVCVVVGLMHRVRQARQLCSCRRVQAQAACSGASMHGPGHRHPESGTHASCLQLGTRAISSSISQDTRVSKGPPVSAGR